MSGLKSQVIFDAYVKMYNINIILMGDVKS